VNVLILIHSPFAMWNIPHAHVERLASQFPQHHFRHARNEDEGAEMIADAEVAFSGQVHRAQLDRASQLRWIHSPAAGVGGMLYPEMRARPIVITNSRGMAAETMAEHAVAVTLAMFRRLPTAVRRQTERHWAQDEISAGRPNRTVAGSEILVVGLGAIGTAIASKFTALGAHVKGVRRRQPEADSHPWIGEIAGRDKLHTWLSTADVVIISAPETSETRHMIGARELSLMKRDALLVNLSRGKLVDEGALVHALSARAIGGAALDVFEHEPLAAESSLWSLPGVLITPHTSGFRPDHWDAATTLFATNLRRFEHGEPLLNVVDKEAGY
jgi:phosphoglycerate dehydrogenase-like enzyme